MTAAQQQALHDILRHNRTRLPSPLDVLTLAEIPNVNNVQRDAIAALIASIHALQAADSHFSRCQRAVAEALGIDLNDLAF